MTPPPGPQDLPGEGCPSCPGLGLPADGRSATGAAAVPVCGLALTSSGEREPARVRGGNGRGSSCGSAPRPPAAPSPLSGLRRPRLLPRRPRPAAGR